MNIMLKDVTPLPHHIKTINDTVMGGCSHSRVQITNQKIHFSGEVSLANNGGFASMRGQWPWLNQTIQRQSNGIRIRVQGDGKHYQLRLFTDDNNDGSAYVFNFETKANETCTIDIPLLAFAPRFRGRPVTRPKLKVGDILQYGLLIGDKQAGTFSLCLKKIDLIEC